MWVTRTTLVTNISNWFLYIHLSLFRLPVVWIRCIHIIWINPGKMEISSVITVGVLYEQGVVVAHLGLNPRFSWAVLKLSTHDRLAEGGRVDLNPNGIPKVVPRVVVVLDSKIPALVRYPDVVKRKRGIDERRAA